MDSFSEAMTSDKSKEKDSEVKKPVQEYTPSDKEVQ